MAGHPLLAPASGGGRAGAHSASRLSRRWLVTEPTRATKPSRVPPFVVAVVAVAAGLCARKEDELAARNKTIRAVKNRKLVRLVPLAPRPLRSSIQARGARNRWQGA